MMALPLALGIGSSVTGGLLQANAANQRGRAFDRAAQAGLGAATRRSELNEGAREFFQPQFTQLGERRTEGLTGLLQALGPERAAEMMRLRAAVPGIQAGGATQIDEMIGAGPGNFMLEGAGTGTALQAAREAEARIAPGRALTGMQLARQQIQPFEAAARGDYSDLLTTLGRESGELGRDMGLRRALTGSELFPMDMETADLLARAQHAGGLSNILGQLALNLGPAFGAMGSPPPNPQTSPPPVKPVVPQFPRGYIPEDRPAFNLGVPRVPAGGGLALAGGFN